MEVKKVLVDSSILIDYFRKTNKDRTEWMKLTDQKFKFATSVIAKYEIYSGATDQQLELWDSIFSNIEVIPILEKSVDMAICINATLKRERKQIAIPDLLIAATAVLDKMPLATLNKRHFERIASLELI
jgi:predicted nucleic acid-binding protein